MNIELPMNGASSRTTKPGNGLAAWRAIAIAATAFTIFSVAAFGETPAEKKMQADVLAGRMKVPITAIPAPAEPNAILLYPDAKVDGPDEQWDQFAGGSICRNVVRPTVTPFLPDPAKANGAAVIVAPGGAFLYLGMEGEGYKIARQLADRGIAAFVLKYRLLPTARNAPDFLAEMFKVLAGRAADRAAESAAHPLVIPDVAVEDAKAAVRLVRSRAAEWKIDVSRVGFMGSSAGAMLAVKAGLIDDSGARPNFIASISGATDAIEVPSFAPPLFTTMALDDPLFSGDGGGLLPSWRKAKRPVEGHFYESGGHGLPTPKWFDLFCGWMDTRGLLKAAK